MVGTAAIKDECGSFGPILTDPIITLPPNVLSTYVPPYYSVGSTYTDLNVQNDPLGFVGHAEPLTIADLQCPTFGLGIETSADGSLHTTVGPPWLPIIIPPPEVFTLDPMWSSLCTDLASYDVFESFAIFDPPYALAPESYLVAPSPAASSPKSKGPPHIPANPTAAYDPPATYLPDPADPPSSPAESIDLPVEDSPAAPASAAQPAAVPTDPAARPTTAPDPPNEFSPEPQEGDSTEPGSRGLGSFIFSALGKSDPKPSGGRSANPVHLIPVPGSGVEGITVGGQILSISPSGIYLSGTSYSPGGPAITISGSAFSLVSYPPAIEAPTPEEDPPADNQPFIPSVQTIAGQTVVSNTSGVYVAGSSLSPGGSAVTASNTVISLSPAGTLVIGSSSVILPLADPPRTPLKFDGMTVQAQPSATATDGIALTPGGPGTVINGNSIGLEQGAILDIGTTHLALPAIQDARPKAFILDGMTIQPDSSAALVDGNALTPGGPGASIAGNRVSLEPDGILDVGTSQFALPPAAQETAPPIEHNLNGMALLQPERSAVAVDGITLSPGGPATTINGSSVSLEPSGTLEIGSGRFAVPTGAVDGTLVAQAFEGGVHRAVGSPRFLLCAAVSAAGLWTVVS